MSTLPTIDPNVPVPQAAPVAPSQADDWWNLDPNDPALQTPPQETPVAPGTTPQPTDQWFLKSPDGSIVYRSAEEALKGYSEKDRVIAQQKADLDRARQILAASGVHLGGAPAPQQQDPIVAALDSYLQQPAGQRQPEAVADVVRSIMQQQWQQSMQPLMPLVEHAALGRAVEEAGHRYDPNIPAFVRSPAYSRTLEQWPTLKGAIQTAARDPQFQGMLPELLGTAFNLARGAAPAAPPVQRPAPQSSLPPQMVQPGMPQAPSPGPAPHGGFLDPVAEMFANIPDVPLSKEFFEGRR